MKKKKKYNYNNDNEFIKLNNNINKYNNSVWLPNDNIEYTSLKTNSCFEILKKNNNDNQFNNIKLKTNNKTNTIIYKCLKVELKLNEYQKNIINRWFKAYIIMYNETLRYIKLRNINNEPLILDFKQLRTYHLKETRDLIIEKSQYPNNPKNTKIKTHILDKAIQLACSNYKSALSNLKNKNIKYFRIRYWKINKDSYNLAIEPSYFTKSSLCYNILGKVNAYYNNELFDLNLIKTKYKSECKLIYSKNTNKYELFVPEKIQLNNNDLIEKKQFISLDPGIRTFVTGLSNNDCIKININNKKIETILKKIDNIKKYKPNNKYTRKTISIKTRKIQNLVNELHWKSIDYLTKNYKTIIIGDMSVKKIVNNKNSNISKMTKRLAYTLSFFKFKERLKYKCILNNCNYLEVNERYTSKMCSNCSAYNETLGSNKIFNCDKCNITIDRDLNGSRNICFKCLK